MKRRCQDRVEFAHEWQRWRAEQQERAGTSYAGTDGAVLRELVQVLHVATASDDVIFFAGAVSKSSSDQTPPVELSTGGRKNSSLFSGPLSRPRRKGQGTRRRHPATHPPRRPLIARSPRSALVRKEGRDVSG